MIAVAQSPVPVLGHFTNRFRVISDNIWVRLCTFVVEPAEFILSCSAHSCDLSCVSSELYYLGDTYRDLIWVLTHSRPRDKGRHQSLFQSTCGAGAGHCSLLSLSVLLFIAYRVLTYCCRQIFPRSRNDGSGFRCCCY